jgi:RNA polymerase sigma-70 factor (ECF subfamily)
MHLEGMVGAERIEGVGRIVTEVDRARAFERFTDARLERAYRLAGLLLRDRSEAEDAVHEAAIVAWRRWPDLRDTDRLDAWFDRILVNECRARLRRRRIREVSIDVATPGARDVGDGIAELHAPTTASPSSCAMAWTSRRARSRSAPAPAKGR